MSIHSFIHSLPLLIITSLLTWIHSSITEATTDTVGLVAFLSRGPSSCCCPRLPVCPPPPPPLLSWPLYFSPGLQKHIRNGIEIEEATTFS